jgi:hypothetical protein
MHEQATYNHFKNLLSTVNIDMKQKSGSNFDIGFDREDFMRLMDFYTLVVNGIDADSELYVFAFRTDNLTPGTHLLSTFIVFEERYGLQVKFSDDGKTAYFNSGMFVKFVRELLNHNARNRQGEYQYAWL